MNHLRREQAPLSDAAWRAVDAEASRTLRQFLAGRRLVDFTGPLGWEFAGDRVARVAPIENGAGVTGVEVAVRIVPGLLELRTPFSVDLAELEDIERGRPDPDLRPVVDAARRAAEAEDRAIFGGVAAAGIAGMGSSSAHAPVPISDDYDAYPSTVARAVEVLREAGIEGPYAIALGPRCYTGVIETTEHGGYPVLEHIRSILAGPVVWAQAVDGAIVVSLRGGDFELLCGEDYTIGYTATTGTKVDLYLEETILPRVIEPQAAVRLVYP
jgi:uncharacterized linocin/CFP29 family protein